MRYLNDVNYFSLELEPKAQNLIVFHFQLTKSIKQAYEKESCQYFALLIIKMFKCICVIEILLGDLIEF